MDRAHHAHCTRAKASWVRTEIRAHVELKTRGHTARYKRLEHASERAFKKAHQAGCGWTRGTGLSGAREEGRAIRRRETEARARMMAEKDAARSSSWPTESAPAYSPWDRGYMFHQRTRKRR